MNFKNDRKNDNDNDNDNDNSSDEIIIVFYLITMIIYR